jgi:subtilase family serine protease
MHRKSFSLQRQLAVLSGILFGLTLSSSGQAVWGHAQARITGPVDPQSLTTLKGNTLAVASPSNDRGRVPDETPTGRLLLQLKPGPDQQAALDSLVRAQQDPKSPSYHKWLTTSQYAQQFGASDADIETVSGFLSQQGFNVSRVLPNKLAIEFSGTTGQLRSTFKTEIHSFTSKGQTFFANDRDPQIPAALTPVVAGFVSLNNYSAVSSTASAKAVAQKVIGKRGGAHAMYTDPTAGAQGEVNLSPQDIATIYDIPGSATGAGVTIGLVGNSNVNLTYVQNYRTTFSLGTKTPVVVIDGDDPGITVDNDVDVAQLELLSAVAPSAAINYYTSASTDLGTGVNYALIRAVDDDAVQVLLLSQESCEANLGATFNAFINAVGEQASALGISVISPAGDGGSAACDSDRGYGNTYHQEATLGLAVNGYASSPFVTAVGATDFYYPPAERTPEGVIACCWNVNNGGSSGYESALGYIQEQPWNDSNTANNGLPSAALLATGGGVSTLGASNDDQTASSPYLEPAWQVPVVPSALSSSGSVPARVVPDVSIFGGDGENGSAYMVCLQADECVNGTPSALVYEQAGGSATAAATFAGVTALVVQSHGAQGNINPTLYSMYSTVPAAFHDVVNGTNTVQCTTGSPNCGSGGFLVDGTGALAYSATTGYDAASGLGSVDVAKLISGWAPPNTTATTTNFTLTTVGTSTPITTFVHGTTVQANINVTSASGTPTGDVAVIAGTAAPSSAGINFFTLANGSAVETQGVSGLPGGTYKLTARYAGDTTYAASVSSPITVTISPEASKIITESTSFTPGSSISYGTPITVQLYVYSLNNVNSIGTPTGSVTVTDLGANLTVIPLDAQGYATFTTILPAGAHSLGFSYGGDASYQASSLGSNIAVSVNTGATTTALTSSNSNDGRGDYVQLVAVVSTNSVMGGSLNWPTGTITFSTIGTGAKTLGTSTLVPGNNLSGRVAGIANFQLPGSKLPTNPALITATYVPATSSNYAASLSNVLSLTTQSAATLNTSTTTIATSDGKGSYFDYDGSVTLNLTVTGGGAQPTGTVSLFSNGHALGTVTLSGNSGTYTIAQDPNTGVLPLLIGRNVITAQYNGDATHATSTRELSLTILDEGFLPDFSLQSNAAFGTITANSSATAFTLQLTSINNFAGLGQKVTFTSAAPTGITCTFGSKTVTFTTTATYATNTISCGAANGYTIASAEPAQRPLNGFWAASGGAALATVLLLGMPARRKSWRKMLGSLAVILCIGLTAFATAGLTGCGGNRLDTGHSIPAMGASNDVKPAVNPQATRTLAPGTYQVLVTATGPFATNVQSNTATVQTHTLPLQIVVQ